MMPNTNRRGLTVNLLSQVVLAVTLIGGIHIPKASAEAPNTSTSESAAAPQATPTAAAFLGFRFIRGAQPITPEETERLGKIETHLKQRLEQAQAYKFTEVSSTVRDKITTGQSIGECGGCEIDYGKDLGVPLVMWGTVQKVSNLILNINIYMADVDQRKMLFIKSVDIRGNTDETWEQGLNYMLKRYILKAPPTVSASKK